VRQKGGFKPESVERTLNRVNQTQLADNFDVILKIIKRKAKDLIPESPAYLNKHSHPTQYGTNEEKVVAFVTLLCNRPKPLPP